MRGKNYGDQNGKNGKPTTGAQSGGTRRRTKGTTTPADWGNADSALVAAAIVAVTRDGSAIRFGYTRDMGAYAVGFYENGTSDTEYIPPSMDIDEWLRGVIDDYGK